MIRYPRAAARPRYEVGQGSGEGRKTVGLLGVHGVVRRVFHDGMVATFCRFCPLTTRAANTIAALRLRFEHGAVNRVNELFWSAALMRYGSTNTDTGGNDVCDVARMMNLKVPDEL